MPRKMYPDDFSGLIDDELAAMKVLMETDLASVKQQLDEAKGNAQAYGEYSDPNWYARAKGAVRVLGIKHQQVLTEMSKRRRERSQGYAGNFDRAFVEAARIRLEPDTFREICMDAKEAIS